MGQGDNRRKIGDTVTVPGAGGQRIAVPDRLPAAAPPGPLAPQPSLMEIRAQRQAELAAMQGPPVEEPIPYGPFTEEYPPPPNLAGLRMAGLGRPR